MVMVSKVKKYGCNVTSGFWLSIFHVVWKDDSGVVQNCQHFPLQAKVVGGEGGQRYKWLTFAIKWIVW